MIKIYSKDCHNVIYGCPYCDGFDVKERIMLCWDFGRWIIAVSPSNQTYADAMMKNADFCPACGRELPDLTNWRIIP